MSTGKVFTTGRSQAVRLPKECRFTVKDVVVAKIGDMVVLYPRKKGWELMARGIERFTDDFLAERDQPHDLDDRPGL